MDRSWEVCDAPGIEGKGGGRSLGCAKSRPRDRVLLDFGLAPASPLRTRAPSAKTALCCLLLALHWLPPRHASRHCRLLCCRQCRRRRQHKAALHTTPRRPAWWGMCM